MVRCPSGSGGNSAFGFGLEDGYFPTAAVDGVAAAKHFVHGGIFAVSLCGEVAGGAGVVGVGSEAMGPAVMVRAVTGFVWALWWSDSEHGHGWGCGSGNDDRGGDSGGGWLGGGG